MINNPYQQQINSYVPQYNPYQYASMSNMQRYQAQPEQMVPAQMSADTVMKNRLIGI